MKTVHPFGFKTGDMHVAEKWERILRMSEGTLGVNGNWLTTDEWVKLLADWPGKLTVHFNPYERWDGPDDEWNEAREQDDFVRNCNRAENALVAAGRTVDVIKIVLECETWEPKTDEEIAYATRLYAEAYNFARGFFPDAPTGWYADLDSPHRLDKAPKDFHSCHAYHLYKGYHTLTNIIRSCHKAAVTGLPLTVFVSWQRGTTVPFPELEPILAWKTGCILASTNTDHYPLNLITDVGVWPHPADERFQNGDECWDAFLLGLDKQPWPGGE